MSEVSQRNFVDFRLGDNVYELAGGLIPDIAERLDVKLDQEPNSGDLQAIMDKVGPNSVLRHNQEVTAIDRDTMAAMVTASGLQGAINRSLWTPKTTAGPETVDAILAVTCMGNWQDEALEALPEDLAGKPAYSLGGIRVMDTETEVLNRNVNDFSEAFKRYPLEAEYAGSVIVPKMVARGFQTVPVRYETKKGDVLLENLFRDNPHLLKQRIVVVRNANAGIISAAQMRAAARRFNPYFDVDPTRPQALVITAEKPLAPTAREDEPEHSRQFQKVSTAFRQVVLTGMQVHKAGRGE
jgi:hypothetical protein